MPFSFLNPWLWLGALAIAAPIWLHLRRKQEKNLVRFSAVRFLEDQPQPKRSPLRLRDVLLFALRALAVLLLVGAFAWPFLKQIDGVIVRESRVFILDNTLSHQANGAFDRARARLADEIQRASQDTQLAVVELAGNPRVVVSFSDDRQLAREKVQQLSPSFERGSFLGAFRQAATLLDNSLGQRKRLVLVSDSQENQWSEAGQTPAFLQSTALDLPEPGSTNAPNVSIAEPRVQRVFLGDKSLITFTAQLWRMGDAPSAEVLIRANGQEIVRRKVEFETGLQAISLQAQWEADPDQWLTGDISIEAAPDALAPDNKAHFCLAPVREGKVALLAQSPFLRIGLGPDVMRGRWATRVIDPSKLDAETSADAAEVLVIESQYLQSAEARSLVQLYLTNGRGVLLALNRVTPAVTGFLRDMGFEVQGASSGQGVDNFAYVLGSHPVFHPFVASDFGNLTEVKVLSHARVRSPQAMPLVFSKAGDPLLFQGTGAKNKLFVSAFGFDRAQTSWPLHVTFVPFLDLCLQAARADDSVPDTFEPGEAFVFRVPSGVQAAAVSIRSGDNVVSRVDVAGDRAQLIVPRVPGIFELWLDGRSAPERMFSVNVPPKESRLNYVAAADMVKAWQLPAARSSERPTATRAATRAGLLNQHLWWWLLLAALAGLAVEMAWISARPNATVGTHPSTAKPQTAQLVEG